MKADRHDAYPKPDLDGNYLGDGYPLCSDIPVHSFLKGGARYQFLGYRYEGSDVLTLSEESALYAALCGGFGTCTFVRSVVLDSSLECHNEECKMDTLHVVNVGTGYYKFVPPTCVHHFFYNGQLVKKGGK